MLLKIKIFTVVKIKIMILRWFLSNRLYGVISHTFLMLTNTFAPFISIYFFQSVKAVLPAWRAMTVNLFLDTDGTSSDALER
jgi:hypothetical protein